MTTHARKLLLPNGDVEIVQLEECRCLGIAKKKQDGSWTAGRRGPLGGVCGGCGNATPNAPEAGQLREALQEALNYCDNATHPTEQYADERERLWTIAGVRENPEAETPGPHSAGR